MKTKILIGLVSMLLAFSACESDQDFEQLNRDPKQPTTIAPDPIFVGATKLLFDEMVNTYDGFSDLHTGVFTIFSRYLTQTQFNQESNYNLSERQIESVFWQRMYQVLGNLSQAKQFVQDDEFLSSEDKASRMAQITILEVYTWQILVDTFGNIPYTEALDTNNLTPSYDDARAIYTAIIAELNTAISTIENGTGFTDSDLIYSGDLGQWRKFANALKLKIGITLADADLATAQRLCEEAYADGVFTSNADRTKFQYLTSPPNTNPLWNILVQIQRNDYVISDAFVDTTTDLNDPRQSVFFDDNVTPFRGGIFGADNIFVEFTSFGETFKAPDLEGVIMSYAEVQFYLSEAAQRGFAVGGTTAAEYYTQGIRASMDYWNIPTTDTDTYLAQTDVVYDASRWQEQLGTQFWIAMFNQAFEGWKAYRKYDFAVFPPAAQSGENVPTRFLYPQTEKNINTASQEAAATAIGGDSKATRLFWDIN